MMNFRKIGANTIVFGGLSIVALSSVNYVNADGLAAPFRIEPGFKIPPIGSFLSNLIRLFFFIAGLVALIYFLMGAFEWITSGGKEEAVGEARGKIQSAALGLIVMVAVLTLAGILEQVVFGGNICMGITCDLDLGKLTIINPK